MKKLRFVLLIALFVFLLLFSFGCDKSTDTELPLDMSENDENHRFFGFSDVTYNEKYGDEGSGEGFLIGDDFDFNEIRPSSKVDTSTQEVMPYYTVELNGETSNIFRINHHGLYPYSYTFTQAGEYILTAHAFSSGTAITKKYTLKVEDGDIPTEITYSYKRGEDVTTDVRAGEENIIVATVKTPDGLVTDDYYQNHCYWQDGDNTLEGRYYYKEYEKTKITSTDTLYFCFAVENNRKEIYTVKDEVKFTVTDSIAKTYVDFDTLTYGQGYIEFNVSLPENRFLDTALPYIEYHDGTNERILVSEKPQKDRAVVYVRYTGESDFSVYDPAAYNRERVSSIGEAGYRVSNENYIFDPTKTGDATIRFVYCHPTENGFVEEIIEGSEKNITIMGNLPTDIGFTSIGYTDENGTPCYSAVTAGTAEVPLSSGATIGTIDGIYLLDEDGVTSPLSDYTVRFLCSDGQTPATSITLNDDTFTITDAPSDGYVIEISSVFAPAIKKTITLNIFQN